jgi:hypothetical protein
VLKKCQPGMPLSEEDLKNISAWVMFYNIPLEYCCSKKFNYAANVFGKPLPAGTRTEYFSGQSLFLILNI